MDQRYYFHHIPKTAGTTVISWLKGTGRFSVMPGHLWSDLLARPRSELERYDLFHGHFYRALHRYLPFQVVPFVFLRNPIDRAISHYEHIRRSPDHYFYSRANEQGSLLAFLRDPVTRRMVENFQVRALCNALDPQAIRNELGTSRDHPFALEREIEKREVPLDDEAALVLAKDYLTRCCVIGITERLKQSIHLLSVELDIMPPSAIERLNARPENNAGALVLSQEELSELTPLLRNDWLLYEFALTLFDRAISDHSLVE